jgi:ferritin-like metal-binding protein YciE
MGNARDDLLFQLRRIQTMERDTELLLRKLNTSPALGPELAVHTAACLEATLEHRRQIGSCIERIEGKTDEGAASSPTLVPNLPVVSVTPVEELPESLAATIEDLYQESIREIASYISLIATAETGGFFETRLICDGILLHKSSMATWLGDRISPTSQACAGEDAGAAAYSG